MDRHEDLIELLVKIRTQLSETIRTIDNANTYVLQRFIADEQRRALERHRLEWEKNNGPSFYNSLAEDEID